MRRKRVCDQRRLQRKCPKSRRARKLSGRLSRIIETFFRSRKNFTKALSATFVIDACRTNFVGVLLTQKFKMCIRKVLSCPACDKLGKPLDVSISPVAPNQVFRIIANHECGRDYCNWFSNGSAAIWSDQVFRTCGSSRCLFQQCRIDPVIEICCDGKNRWFSYRTDDRSVSHPPCCERKLCLFHLPNTKCLLKN